MSIAETAAPRGSRALVREVSCNVTKNRSRFRESAACSRRGFAGGGSFAGMTVRMAQAGNAPYRHSRGNGKSESSIPAMPGWE